MEEKLRKLMKHEGLNSTRLAEMLGIQASGISHIMSGRNKPSFDFLIKLLQRFPQINPDWLLMDKGPMYRDEIKSKNSVSSPPSASASVASIPNTHNPAGGLLFSESPKQSVPIAQSLERDDNDIIPASTETPTEPSAIISSQMSRNLAPASSIERIVVFFKDKTFSEYQPG